MMSYNEFTKFFGAYLLDEGFQRFLSNNFSDLTAFEDDYLISELRGFELGFVGNEDILEIGNPIFSHFIIYSKAVQLINVLPFDVTFNDTRNEVLNKAGQPTQTNRGFSDLLRKKYLVDNYKIRDIIVTFDYNAEQETINHLQFRDNNMLAHLKL